MKNSGILFATRKDVENYISENYPKAELRNFAGSIDDFVDDSSMRYVNSRSGECEGYDVYDDNGELLVTVAWWEEGGEYKVRKNGEVVRTATNWGEAQHFMTEINDDLDLEEEASIDCVQPDGEVISFEDL